jgi:Zn-dependent peptidase ImmA (M78 family)
MSKKKKQKKVGSPGGELGFHKLTWKQVDRIRELRTIKGTPYKKLAEKFGVSSVAVRKICAYITWVPAGMTRNVCVVANGERKGRGRRLKISLLTEDNAREICRRAGIEV